MKQPTTQPKAKKYAIVGTGARIVMFSDPIARDFKDSAALIAFCDSSKVRMEYHKGRILREFGVDGIATYAAEEFDKMLDEQKPDVVIVCTTDVAHSEYIIRSVRKGCDVICEKPITTDVDKCRDILRDVPPTGKNVRVTFNLRWVPGLCQLRRMVASGVIGNVKHVNLEYMLNTSHGADYFRRWHSQKDCSGGLLVHKSTHHFDVVNWLLNSIPSTVYAIGDLVFYGKKNAIARGDAALAAYDRYAEANGANDPFFLDLKGDESLRGLYLEAEKETGYIRDKNVFRDGITIEDSMSVLVRYRSGAMLNYSLNAFCPYEGYRIHLSGDKGRIEYEERHPTHIIKGQSEEELAAEQEAEGHSKSLKHYPFFGKMREIPVEEIAGSHGGGDRILQEQMFSAVPAVDHDDRNAGYEQGIASAIIGIAANASMASGEPIKVDDLVTLKPGTVKLSDLV